MAAFTADVRGVVGRHQKAVGAGADIPALYAAVGQKYGLTKQDFNRALVAAHDSNAVRLGGWPRTLHELPDPELAPVVSAKVMGYVHTSTGSVAGIDAMAGEGDTSLNTSHPAVRAANTSEPKAAAAPAAVPSPNDAAGVADAVRQAAADPKAVRQPDGSVLVPLPAVRRALSHLSPAEQDSAMLNLWRSDRSKFGLVEVTDPSLYADRTGGRDDLSDALTTNLGSRPQRYGWVELKAPAPAPRARGTDRPASGA